MAEAEARGTPDDADEPMYVLQAMSRFLLDQSDAHMAKIELFDSQINALETNMAEHSRHQAAAERGDPGAAALARSAVLSCARVIPKALALLARIQGWGDRPVEVNSRLIRAAKDRSDTSKRKLEGKLLEEAGDFARIIRDIVAEIASPEQVDVLEYRLGEVLEGMGVELKPRKAEPREVEPSRKVEA